MFVLPPTLGVELLVARGMADRCLCGVLLEHTLMLARQGTNSKCAVATVWHAGTIRTPTTQARILAARGIDPGRRVVAQQSFQPTYGVPHDKGIFLVGD